MDVQMLGKSAAYRRGAQAANLGWYDVVPPHVTPPEPKIERAAGQEVPAVSWGRLNYFPAAWLPPP
jgi:hypothetical protein